MPALYRVEVAHDTSAYILFTKPQSHGWPHLAARGFDRVFILESHVPATWKFSKQVEREDSDWRKMCVFCLRRSDVGEMISSGKEKQVWKASWQRKHLSEVSEEEQEDVKYRIEAGGTHCIGRGSSVRVYFEEVASLSKKCRQSPQIRTGFFLFSADWRSKGNITQYSQYLSYFT